ncbi:MAG: 1-deoxy-D-xylulose-5-phosphate synthase [Candidatus Gastranaerophilales bacterium]|nr:1-deoxy-D-xylulose-5-phosphate synthase [Candidatus Gastranaerophilales bacterium]
MGLDKINSPQDIKNLSIEELKIIASDIRKGILNRVNKIGGHLGPDLGIVEATIAMHYVFNSPIDKIVFDVSHQIYPHKMLTGRKHGFLDEEKLFEITGYSNPDESEHDNFIIGHTSTSISLACGLAKARDLKKENYNVIALIGDGSLSGGEAYEGFNNAAMLNSNFIAIVNDNEMSIAKNQGGLYKNLEDLRKNNGNVENNFFKSLGFEYIYLNDGNDIEKLIETFKKVKDSKKPIVVHIHTLKGKGYEPAEENKERYHWTIPNFMDDNQTFTQKETYESITTDFILDKKSKGEPVVAITPATPGATGFYQEFRDKLGENYTDVGIAEEHAIAYASALAKNGAKPILAVLSSFIQRTYDQLSQDLALNKSPAIILVFWGAITNADSTHLGVFDIPLVSNIPNIVHLNPTNKEEYIAMLNWAYNQNEHPVVIRVPYMECYSSGINDDTDYSDLNKFKVLNKGEKIGIIALGNFLSLGKAIKEELKFENINATLINPCFASRIDEDLLNQLKENHKIIITLEDGVLDGGFGEKISRFYSKTEVKVLNYGAKKEFTDRIPIEKLYQKYRLTKEQIKEDILHLI